MKIDRLFAAFNVSALGLTAQRKRMNTIASNIANAETTRTEDGTPYRRKVVTMQANQTPTFADSLHGAGTSVPMNVTDSSHLGGSTWQFRETDSLPGSVEATEEQDMSEFKIIHDPSHPDADENGYVKVPNVNIVTEMVDMMSASRAFEANITVINAQKQMAKDSLEI